MVFKTHAIFKTDKHAIQLIAYFDEVELCNPLGSNTKKHKLGCIFFFNWQFAPKISFKAEVHICCFYC